MSILDGLRNLERQQPLRGPDGRWNVAVWVDTRGLNGDQKILGECIEDLAREEDIRVCQNALKLIEAQVHTLFVVGHNVGWERAGVLKDVSSLGKKLAGRYIILNSCGGPYNYTQEVRRRLLEETEAVGVYAYFRKIPIRGVYLMFKEFTRLGHHKPSLLPGDAVNLAIKKVLASTHSSWE